MPGQISGKTKGSDQRYLPRWEVENRILYKFDHDNTMKEARSKDISCSGACFKTDEFIPKKQTIKLTIFLSEKISVQMEGSIVWTKTTSDGFLVGVNFTNTSHKAQDLILEYAFEFKKDDPVKHWFQGWDN